MDDLTLAPVDELIELCKTLDPPLQVSMDPADLNLPAGWLAVDQIHPVNLAGALELRCNLHIVAPDQDPRRALATLAPIFSRLRAVLTPDGPVETIGVVMPDSATPMPALRVPIYLYT